MPKKISPKEEESILELHHRGWTRTKIKEVTGISIPTIREVLRKSGVAIISKHNAKPYSSDQKEEIKHRFESGEIPAHIACSMKLNKKGVLKFLRRHYKEAAQKFTQYPGISPVEFIDAWQTSFSVKEVAEKLGMTRGAARGRAFIYRKKGISLKRMNRDAYDWEALANFASLYEEEE